MATAQGNTRPTPTTGGEIRGRVVNAATKAPVGNAAVEATVVGSAGSAARVSTGADGAFRVRGLRTGRYRVRILAIGYAPRALPPVAIDSASPSVDLGTVALTATTVELQSVTVTERQQEMQLTPDRNIYVVRDMPSTRGGTALDVLRNVPSVDVDIDNIVSLRGNSGVIIQINGRPSPMKPGPLGNFLSQLPADIVEKVEVIPNPSARDDPEGVAGIINIVLKQEADAGTSGGLTISGGTTGSASIGGNLGYQQAPLSLYGSYGFLRDDRPRTDAVYRENRYLSPMTYLEESGTRTQLPLAHTLTGTAGYKPGKHDEFSADVVYSTRAQAETYGILYRNLDNARVVTGLDDRTTRGNGEESSFEAALSYRHSFATKGHKFSGELRFDRGLEGGPSNVGAHTLAANGTPTGTTALENSTGWEHPHVYSLKLDYSRPLSGHVRVEAGYKGALQGFHTTLNTTVYDTATATYRPDSTRISDFTYDQYVNAAYGMLVAQVGKFVLQGGVRVEQANTQFHVNTTSATYDIQYNSIFPSGLIAYNIDDAHQVKLSFSTRIRRPDDGDLLDPTLHFQDPLNVSRGNPYLKPEYISALELGLQRSGERVTFQLTPFFRRTYDAVRTIRTIDTAGVTTRTFANVSTSDAYGTDATVALSGGKLTGFVGASAFRQESNAANLGPGLSASTFGWTARTNASYKFSKTLDMQGLLFYQAPMTVEQGWNASRARFSLAVRQKLMDDRMSVTLRVIDPLNMSRESSTTNDARFYQVSDRTRAIRGVALSVNWMFGKPEKGRDREPLDPGGDGPP